MDISTRSLQPGPAASYTAPAALEGNGARRPSTSARRLTSDSLLDGQPEVLIEHRGSEYRLRLTALGKLILTK